MEKKVNPQMVIKHQIFLEQKNKFECLDGFIPMQKWKWKAEINWI